ncbi:hypothetical protein CHS0354_029452 [Potamilus streckersoni]|uniref:Uncharacterized protein n=1 Tax=Potamilus streckersoni TaxID=2493646 RepID=A0AAE0W1D5_9BIVA|nr:hypothetical protein CHS0354_029452 [Potamilus streckersoni]
MDVFSKDAKVFIFGWLSLGFSSHLVQQGPPLPLAPPLNELFDVDTETFIRRREKAKNTHQTIKPHHLQSVLDPRPSRGWVPTISRNMTKILAAGTCSITFQASIPCLQEEAHGVNVDSFVGILFSDGKYSKSRFDCGETPHSWWALLLTPCTKFCFKSYFHSINF